MIIKISILTFVCLVFLTRLVHSRTTTTTITTTTTTRTTTTPPPPIRCYNDFCLCQLTATSTYTMTCNGFDSFSELEFPSSESGIGQFDRINRIEIIPNSRIALDDSLNLTGLALSRTGYLVFSNLDRIALDSTPIRYLNVDSNFHLVIVNSKFEFTYENEAIVTRESCLELLSSSVSLMTVFPKTYDLELDYVEMITPVCPYVFRNVKFNGFNIKNMPQGSQIEFVNIHNNNYDDEMVLDPSSLVNELNCNITGGFKIENSFIGDVDAITHVLNYDVFRKTTLISFFNSQIGRIRPDTFKFLSLTSFKFSPSNWRSFLTANTDMSWMASLNSRVNVNLSNPSEIEKTPSFPVQLGNLNDTYTYPNEDFCFFRGFPHFRNILPAVYFAWNSSCSCTLMSILQYSKFHKYSFNSDFGLSNGNKYCMTTGYQQVIRDCNFEAREEACDGFTEATNDYEFTEDSTTIRTFQSSSSTTIASSSSSSISSVVSSSSASSSSSVQSTPRTSSEHLSTTTTDNASVVSTRTDGNFKLAVFLATTLNLLFPILFN